MASIEYDCPNAEVCKTCPCAAEDDACFPGERLRAEVERLRFKLHWIVKEAEKDEPSRLRGFVLGITEDDR